MLNLNMLFYSLAIGFFLALHNTGLKTIKGDSNTILSIIYLILALTNFLLFYIKGGKDFTQNISENFIGILFVTIGSLFFYYLMIKGYQKGFNLVLFVLTYNIISVSFLLFINYYFFKGVLNIYNIFGLILGIMSIFFLNFK